MSADDLILHYFEDIKEGQSASLAKTISESDIYLFAGLSMDTNPAHVNEDYAQTTVFKTRIAHGMLSAGFISAVLGTRLPGPGAIYVNQSLKFKAPVRIGDTVTATVTVTGLVPEKKFVTFRTTCTVAGKVVIEGEATVMVPARG
ncbi:MaoC family dehydratase [Rhodospirillum rubrum]|uniref:(R)-specific enoyl-CoA hydratase n=1 Tax=Rhodospirillum rubrum (strain ATCC 11170 / ATH 1.1.1 / DSM 467 / LMG 4362 / NCIMB 8255 / S1) TaxID=269796 RepID=PHAJ_RHORT|nr:MaoC family dehydratase [Rhodospirillum rubrum]Q2RQ36.1 RecName: Full=(R)-specific enoyl-CoA hydratase; AltName: Full=(R)-specific trans-2,3-enoylacyl-CoA hydratase [Rhodospirillum rubrum ATCC 11170]ABC23759.1 MaoC-like dehydratase [Rhodospirillum rubrum ATCC 11170]AEO49499.1 MaoC-like dehydratase [Rhodospirillum rubrum F11]MBK1664480.1 (R)-hydratase [Rhodospirillum rubrum]MBK1676263.1 (R)-hydratase [Rhodospirillum rubrum]MBK5955438.1 (R)-hydratase [Rhodospirillum rubrum]